MNKNDFNDGTMTNAQIITSIHPTNHGDYYKDTWSWDFVVFLIISILGVFGYIIYSCITI